MGTKARYVDILSPVITVQDNAQPVLFEDILRFMENKEYKFGEKYFKFTLFNNPARPEYVEGLVITTQNSDIPPKRNIRTGEFSPVNINTDEEGFAFANVFLYDTQRGILIYEINKNGCFPRQFAEAVYSHWNAPADFTEGDIASQRARFNLNFQAFARRDEYNRMLQMNYFKKIIVELVNPVGLVENQLQNNDSIENWIKSSVERAANCNANVIKIEQVALSRRQNPAGLSRGAVVETVDKVKLLFGRSNIQKLEVQGYTNDAEDPNRCRPIDLMADTFNESFRIDNVQVNRDLQPQARKGGIESLYNRILPEIQEILGR